MKAFTAKLIMCLLLAICLPGISYGTEAFLLIPGIKGESADPRYRDWITGIQSVNWGHQQTGTTVSGTRSTRVLQMSPLTIVKGTDSASVHLARMCAEGRPLPEVVLELRTSPQVPYPFMTVKLRDVLVVDYKVEVPQGQSLGNIARLQETIALTFNIVEWSYRPTDAKGAMGPEIKAGLDVRMMKAQ